MSTVDYELKKPFAYAHKGEQQDASFITLFEPTFKQLEHVTPMKQAATAAIKQAVGDDADGADDAQDDQGEPTASLMMALMYQWDGNLSGVMIHAQELFKSGAAKVDGEGKLTQPLLEKMDLKDFENLVWEYMAAFLAPSLMAGE
jgi:hypothetical protein